MAKVGIGEYAVVVAPGGCSYSKGNTTRQGTGAGRRHVWHELCSLLSPKLLRLRLPLLVLLVCVALSKQLQLGVLPGAQAETGALEGRRRLGLGNAANGIAPAGTLGVVRRGRGMLQNVDGDSESFPFQDVCSRSCQESPWRLVATNKVIRGRSSIAFCVKLQSRKTCTASPCCSMLGLGVEGLAVSVATTGKCNITSVVRVTAGGVTLSRYDNYPNTATTSTEMALMVTDLSTLGLATEKLEVCYETRGCNEWTELCRPGEPGSPQGCRFSVSESIADGWYTCCNSCPTGNLSFTTIVLEHPPPPPSPPPPRRRPPIPPRSNTTAPAIGIRAPPSPSVLRKPPPPKRPPPRPSPKPPPRSPPTRPSPKASPIPGPRPLGKLPPIQAPTPQGGPPLRPSPRLAPISPSPRLHSLPPSPPPSPLPSRPRSPPPSPFPSVLQSPTPSLPPSPTPSFPRSPPLIPPPSSPLRPHLSPPFSPPPYPPPSPPPRTPPSLPTRPPPSLSLPSLPQFDPLLFASRVRALFSKGNGTPPPDRLQTTSQSELVRATRVGTTTDAIRSRLSHVKSSKSAKTASSA